MQEFNRFTKRVIESWGGLVDERLNKHVFIRDEEQRKIENVVSQIAFEPFEVPNWRRKGAYPEGDLSLLSQILYVESQNFAFFYPDKPGERYKVKNLEPGGKDFDGSEGMLHNIYVAFGEKLITTKEASPLFATKEGIKALYKGVNEIPYPDLRLETGRDLIKGLNRYYHGDGLAMIEEVKIPGAENTILAFSDNGNIGLVNRLIEKFPVAFGADKDSIHGYDFPFYKRAQLTPLVIHGRSLDSNAVIPKVKDIDAIGPIADYQVQRAMRFMNMITYGEDMAYRVDHWIPIEKGKEMEVEGRAATVYVVSLLLSKTNEVRDKAGLKKINMSHLDFKLWSLGRRDTTSKPHLTKTTSY